MSLEEGGTISTEHARDALMEREGGVPEGLYHRKEIGDGEMAEGRIGGGGEGRAVNGGLSRGQVEAKGERPTIRPTNIRGPQ